MLTIFLVFYTLSLTAVFIGYKQIRRLATTMSSLKLIETLKRKLEELKALWWRLCGRGSGDRQEDVPGPVYVPIFGTSWIYLPIGKYKMNKIHEAYKDLHARYGNIIIEQTPGGIPIVSLFDRKDIETVLRYPSKYPFRPPTEIVSKYRKSRPDRYASVGLPNAHSEEWFHLRQNLCSGFNSRPSILAFVPALNDICDDFIDLIRKKRDAGSLVENFQELANLISLETVCCFILGRRVGYLDPDFKPENSKFAVLATAVKRLFVLTRDSYYGNGLWRYMPTKLYRDFAATEETIYDVISEVVDETLEEGKLECATEDIRSIYISILQSDLDIRDKKSGIVDFITAGIELVSHTISFLFYYLTQDSSFQDRIYNEFTHCGAHISIDDLTQAAFTKACIQENYRLSPTAFSIARILESDCNLSGYNIRSGTFVLCQTMIACHDEKNFKNASQFVPQRWLDCNENQCSMNIPSAGPGSGLVLPFGTGKRMCPAKRMIEVELSLIVAKILREFRVQFVGELETNFEFLLAPKTPVNIHFFDRH